MRIKLPILEKNHGWTTHSEKLNEECVEVMIAIHDLDNEKKEEIKEKVAIELISEVFDVMQICIGIMDKLLKAYPYILKQSTVRHIKKLCSRGWQFKSWVKIEKLDEN